MYRTQCVLALVALFLGLVHSWDIAIINAGNLVEFYTRNRTKLDTVHFGSQNLTALVYDEVHNMLLYVDKQNNSDAICGYIISSEEYKCYIQRNGSNIQGLAFDPITEILFFTDTKERSINWISFKSGSENNVYGNLLMKIADGIPTDIVVDSCRGFIYWINSNLTTTTIDRARFNGSDREVIINASNNSDIHSLIIDQKTQRIFWILPIQTPNSDIYCSDLNGKDKYSWIPFEAHSNSLITISKNEILLVYRCSDCWKNIWAISKLHLKDASFTIRRGVRAKNIIGIAPKYKISDQIQGVEACKALTSLVPNNCITDDSSKFTREYYVKPFCVHGIQAIGQSLCKCTPGYIGKRCDVSVCENYCLQGDCSLNAEGIPKCRCNAGYNGERCEVSVCHDDYCLNNGTCSLNKTNEPVCQCIDDYAGDRCEVSDCQNYCLQGDCSFNVDGLPKCRCNAGYYGERCEVNACHGYCLNNGNCTSNQEHEPVCQCIDNYLGDRCELSDCLNYCVQGDCSFSDEGVPECRCNAGYNGERCEVNVCHGYCSNNGTCSLNADSEPVCQCIDGYAGDRCDVPVCLNNGDCFLTVLQIRKKTNPS